MVRPQIYFSLGLSALILGTFAAMSALDRAMQAAGGAIHGLGPSCLFFPVLALLAVASVALPIVCFRRRTISGVGDCLALLLPAAILVVALAMVPRL